MDDFRSGTVDLAHPALGSRVVFASDDFFAPKERLISPEEAVFIPGKYDDHGKWMDGWESRRRRNTGHDFCIVRLGAAGTVRGVDIDTSHFTGNFPPAASIEACVSDSEIPPDGTVWTEIVPFAALAGNSHHLLPAVAAGPWTHVKLHIFPDGGVARLRIYGRVHVDWSKREVGTPVDLASALSGARPVACNDEHFGRLVNLTWPGRAATMGEGWETRRRRTPGNDWGILELGTSGTIECLVVDTAHFKGNYPDRVSIQAGGPDPLPDAALVAQSMFWPVLLDEQKLEMDREHVFDTQIKKHGPVRYLRINVIPDGGISRLHAIGKPVR